MTDLVLIEQKIDLLLRQIESEKQTINSIHSSNEIILSTLEKLLFALQQIQPTELPLRN